MNKEAKAYAISLFTFLTLFSSNNDSFFDKTGVGSGSGTTLVGVSTTRKIIINSHGFPYVLLALE